METLLLLTYAAIMIAIFKIFRVPLNKWTVPTAALGGVLLVGALVFTMNYNHPHSRNGVIGFVTTPILPNVRGLVIEIPAQPNVPVKKGDVLFKIDPTPYQAAVDQKKAELAATIAQTQTLEKGIEEQKAVVAQAQSEVERTQQSYTRYLQASKGGSVSELAVENRRQLLAQAQALLNQAKAELERRMLELQSHQHNVIPKLKAELAQAQFDLDSTVVRAPGDGYPIQIFLRPGMMAVPFPVRPTMIFVNQSQRSIIAGYRQNALQRLKVGSKAEIIFPALPGRVFQGKVAKVMPALAEGELQASGSMMRVSRFNEEGLVPVIIDFDDEHLAAFQLPDGASAMVSVYSEHAHHVAVMRQILLRMKSWEHYLYLDH